MSLNETAVPPPTTGKRIGINAHLLAGKASYRRAGIHQYIYQVLRHLPPKNDYTVYTRHGGDLAAKGMKLVSSHWPTERRLVRILWEQLRWPLLAKRHKIDLLHSTAFVLPLALPAPAIVTIYDLSFMHYPERFPSLQRRYLQGQTAQACRRARRVITISESGRQDVHRFFGVPLAQIDVVTPGVDEAYQPLPAEEVAAFRQRRGLPSRFVLHVGTLQPRKNIPTLLEAFARLPLLDVHLVLVGGKGWLYDEIFARVTALNLQERVHFTGYVPDEELSLWYNAAALLAFPSVYEGFGLPVVEAMACGTPVAAANTSSIPEAAGDAALLFDPLDVQELADCMTAVLQDTSLAATMREKGLTQAQQFSWARAGWETAVAYQRALTDIP
ncbi:MAG: glycosyltransferase family 4 protein [Ardenticatenaceae bacterium]|nr:glycosyltransferase family 4 protein [Anaerolineales bacterium]MCB8923225.1 glycosyltransferase family 4 protein [Ardenticatenaceae bacterium]MCB9004830.1 glycosyltransferase family 4 protein [Ardenticatenaceae bacterium]